MTSPVRMPAERSITKRVLDVVVAAAMLALLSPVVGCVAIAVRLRMGGPVVFGHERPGLRGRVFRMLKFRTMREPRPGEDRYLSDGARITPLGAFLRRTSLDELPELWNVLRGDMSLVGPRPLLTRYTPYFYPSEQVRFAVRPGITGLAQVRGRNNAPWDERLAHDVWYVEHWSLALDLRILVESVRAVVRARGVAVDPRSVMLNLDEERGAHPERRAS